LEVREPKQEMLINFAQAQSLAS